jgi:hypothetical protein
MARLKLNEDGEVTCDGEVHIVTSEGLATLENCSPEFLDSVQALSMLIDSVDDAEWQQMAREQFVRLLDAMHSEIFEGCCSTCRAMIDATFRAASPNKEAAS